MKKLLLPLLCAAQFSLTLPALAQVDRATITGTITDTTGARIANAEVVVTQTDTGVSHRTKTNGEGLFTVGALSTGSYRASFQAANFAPLEIHGIRLDIGQTLTLPVKLDVTKVSTQVEVSAAESGLDLSSAQIDGVVHGAQVQDLPLNGRNYVSLVALVPGAIDSGTGTQDQVRFAGLSAEDNSWLLDGVDNSGVNHQYQKVAIRLQPSTEAIAEFHASSLAYGADQGGTPGGQVQLVSRSGTNKYHGSAWEFLRNTYFDATPWGTSGTVPTLRLNNFGANLGGPVFHDRLFFFANWESLRQNQNLSLTGTVPSTSFRAAVLAKSPAMVTILNQYPIGTVAIAGNANAMTWYGHGPSTDQEDSGLLRLDYHVNSRTNAFIRYSTDHYIVNTPADLTGIGYTTLTTPNIVLGADTMLSASILNSIRVGFNRAAFTQGENNTLPYSVAVTGAFTTLDDATGSVRYDNSFTFADDATFIHGRNTIKAGVNIRRIQENKASPSAADEVYTYASTTNFMNNLMDSDAYSGVVPLTGQRMTESFGYILDQFQLTKQLMFNVGMRYEYFGVDHEVLGRGIVVDPLNCSSVICPTGTSWYRPNLTDFSPRLAVSYAPSALRGKAVVRAGYGIYYGPGQFGNLGTPIGNLTDKYTLNQTNAPGLSYPVTPYLGSVSTSFSPSGSPINRRDTAVQEWTLSIQSDIARRTTAQIAYFGNSASHVFSDVTLNGINSATGTRPYAGYSTIDYRGSGNEARTNALQASVKRDFSTGLLLSANYQFSHSLDNGGIGGGEADIAQNYNCHSCEYSSSDQDMRHYFAASSIYQIPVGHGRKYFASVSRTADFLIGGWQISGIGTARSGLPINITVSRSSSALPDQLNKNQRPNLNPGVPIYAAHKTPASWLNAAAFSTPANGTWGNAPRNIARAPGLWQLDTSVQKRFPVTERFGMTFRAEAFNLLNVAHYGTPAHVFAGSNFGVITSSFSSAATGTGTPRELQFMLRADF